MTAPLSKGCTLVLLLSMALALAAGLIAWGPLALTANDHVFADQRSVLGIANALTALACLPLCAVCVWGLQNLLNADWPSELVRPWVAFFGFAFMMSASAALYHLAPDNLGWAIGNTFAAAAFVQLLLGVLAERVDARFGSRHAVVAGIGLAVSAGIFWLAGDTLAGRGDLRGLLLLQALPALLIPAGALGLPGRHTATRDWVAILAVYAGARLAEQADAAVLGATQLVCGHALMHLLLAAGAAVLAYRAAPASAARRAADSPSPLSSPQAAGLAVASQRQTSLNTAGW